MKGIRNEKTYSVESVALSPLERRIERKKRKEKRKDKNE
jgi:hypothetical protein